MGQGCQTRSQILEMCMNLVCARARLKKNTSKEHHAYQIICQGTQI